MGLECKLVPVGDKCQYVFKRVAGDFLYLSALLADHMVMMGLERFGKLGKRRPASDSRSSDTELREEFERAIDTGSVNARCALGYLAVFEGLITCFECLEHRPSWLGNALPCCM